MALLKNEPNAIHTRAWIYMSKGMLDVALADFDRALAIDPELAGAYADRGQAYERKGELDKAIADYRKVLSLKSKQLYDDKAKADARKRLALGALANPEGARRRRLLSLSREFPGRLSPRSKARLQCAAPRPPSGALMGKQEPDA